MWRSNRHNIYLGIFLAVFNKSVMASDINDCWVRASIEHQVPVRLLKAIGKVESDYNPKAHEVLAGGSESIGIMQINSFWYKKLEERGISRSDLWEPCININVGAWILKMEIDRYGYSWKSTGAYNGGAYSKNNKEKKLKHYAIYADKVYRAIKQIK